LSVDPARRRPPIQPYVFGQFIEHLGRCIYGGIWAEMLEDRKFYFPITPQYAPYTSLKETSFPIVGASPWEILGDPAGVVMDTEAPFVGSHSPRLRQGAAIRQRDLGVIADRTCVGYVWARALGAAARVEVRLRWDEGAEKSQQETLEFGPEAFARQVFELTAAETTPSGGSFEIRALEGDVMIGTASLMPSDHVRGLRRDTLDLLRELSATIYRWPGGNFVSGYDFRDGVGDRDRRPPRKNMAWTGVEHNDFGTDEFVDLCVELGAAPMITVNSGFGDAHSAAQWVEYVNGSTDTFGGGWRRDNGHAEPYGVRHWCVGNEMFGDWQLGFMPVWQYIIKHRLFAEAMWSVDRDLVLIGVGDLQTINEGRDAEQVAKGKAWSHRMLEGAADRMSLISEHLYGGRLPWKDQQCSGVKEHVGELRQAIRRRAEGHRELQARIESLEGRIVPIALDEWNYWHRGYQYGELGCAYDLADGLGVAAGLHEYFRHTDIIHMAHYAQTVNVIGAIKTTKIAAELETTGLVLALYRKRFERIPLELDLDTTPLDVAAAIDESGTRLTVGVVNPTRSPVGLELGYPGTTRGWCITGPEPESHNTPGQPRVVDVAPLERASDQRWVLPPLSCSVIELTA
jgi:alpha-N-arabinofuranosidase